MSQDLKILIDIQAQVSTVASKLDSLAQAYEEGKAAQLIKAQVDEAHFQEIKDELFHKVDKRRVQALLILNAIIVNWRLGIVILVALSAVGVVTIRGHWIDNILNVTK